MADKIVERKKRIPWRKRDGWISFIPDTLNLILYLFLLYASYELENKLIPIAFASYAVRHTVNIFYLASQRWDKKQSKTNTLDEEDSLWRVSINKIAELTIAAFLLISVAKFAIPKGFHIGTADGWIGFAGSIIAGLITMMALLFTLRHERSIREEDSKTAKKKELKDDVEKLEMQKRSLMPIPLLLPVLHDNELVSDDGILDFEISNRSNNGMFLKYIKPLESEFMSSNIITNEEIGVLFTPYVYLLSEQLVPSNSSIVFNISVHDDEVSPILIQNRINKKVYIYDLTLSFEIVFSDILEMQDYSCIVTQGCKLVDQSTNVELKFVYYDFSIRKTSIPKRIFDVKPHVEGMF